MTHDLAGGAASLTVPPAEDLRRVPSQTFWMGSSDHYPDEAPQRFDSVDGLWIQRRQVTKAKFARLVADTEYPTVAERPLDPADLPAVPR